MSAPFCIGCASVGFGVIGGLLWGAGWGCGVGVAGCPLSAMAFWLPLLMRPFLPLLQLLKPGVGLDRRVIRLQLGPRALVLSHICPSVYNRNMRCTAKARPAMAANPSDSLI